MNTMVIMTFFSQFSIGRSKKFPVYKQKLRKNPHGWTSHAINIHEPNGYYVICS